MSERDEKDKLWEGARERGNDELGPRETGRRNRRKTHDVDRGRDGDEDGERPMQRKHETELKRDVRGCVDRDGVRETRRDQRKQEIEIRRKEPEIYRETDVEDQREGQKDTKKSRTSPTKETETCLGRNRGGGRKETGGPIKAIGDLAEPCEQLAQPLFFSQNCMISFNPNSKSQW